MTRPRRLRHSAAVLLVAAALIGQACGEPSRPATSSPPSSSASTSPSQSAAVFEPTSWPPDGDAPCDQAQPPDANHGAYTGTIRRIRATDAVTVVFDLCAPDVAFPVKLAFPAFAINDSAWLLSHTDPGGGQQAITREVNGTGAYRLEAWNRGSEIDLVRNQAYRGEIAQNERLIVRWRDGAGTRLSELQAGTVDGIDDVAPADFQTVEDNVDLQPLARAGMNVFYAGFNNTYAPFDDPKVRQAIAMGIDREKIVQALYPPGSEVASHFSPCAVRYGCTGKAWYEFDRAAAQQLLADAGFPDGFDTTIQYRDVVRSYLPAPSAVASALQAELLTNLNIRAELEVLPEAVFLTTVDEGRADGIHLLGRKVSIPDVSNVLDPHFGAGATKEFGEAIDPLVNALAAGASTIDDAARSAAYSDANDAIRASVPMIPIAHAGSMTAYRADVTGAQSSPMRYERVAAMTPGDRRQFVWLTSIEPEGLYCADEIDPVAELVCSQVTEGLYAFAPDSAFVGPALARACKPNPELTAWTCTLRTGVTFHDGAGLDANDVVLSFAVQWDADHPRHLGREGTFQPFIDTFGGLLNPPG